MAKKAVTKKATPTKKTVAKSADNPFLDALAEELVKTSKSLPDKEAAIKWLKSAPFGKSVLKAYTEVHGKK